MKWILLATVLDWQPVYDDQKTCQLAAEELKKVYYQEVAACIPKPSSTAANDQVTLAICLSRCWEWLKSCKK